jgi:hypothetical protein
VLTSPTPTRKIHQQIKQNSIRNRELPAGQHPCAAGRRRKTAIRNRHARKIIILAATTHNQSINFRDSDYCRLRFSASDCGLHNCIVDVPPVCLSVHAPAPPRKRSLMCSYGHMGCTSKIRTLHWWSLRLSLKLRSNSIV